MNTISKFKVFNTGLFTGLLDSAIKVNLQKPINESQALEAKDKNLSLISRSTNANYNYYMHDECKHFDFLQPTHVRRRNFICSTCFHSKLTNEAKEQGFQFLHCQGERRKYIRPCGHISVLSSQAVNNYKNVKCTECFEEYIKTVSEVNEYEYINNDGFGVRTIRFKNCGHTKSTHQSQLQKGNVVCRICVEDKHVNQCKENGLKILKITEKARYRQYLLPCGHEKVLRMDHAESNSYQCEQCENTHYSKPSNLYLLKIQNKDFTWLKLGFAKDIDLRQSSYGLPPKTQVTLLSSVYFETGLIAMQHEKELHRVFKKHRYSKSLMKNYHKFNGFTECYNVSIESELISSIKALTMSNQTGIKNE